MGKTQKGLLPGDVCERVCGALAGALIDLTDLSLQAKQAHWNLAGARFQPIHGHLDTLVADLRAWSDEIAEREVTLGRPADGRVATVADGTSMPEFPAGWVSDDDVVRLIAERLEDVVRRTREWAAKIREDDPVTEAILIDVLAGLEKHYWMFSSYQS